MLIKRIVTKWLVDGGVHRSAMMCNRPVKVGLFLEECGVGVWNKERISV